MVTQSDSDLFSVLQSDWLMSYMAYHPRSVSPSRSSIQQEYDGKAGMNVGICEY